MKKIIVFPFVLLFLVATAVALNEGTYGSGAYGSNAYGVAPSASSSFSDSSVDVPADTPTTVEANQTNVTLNIVTNTSVTGAVTVVKYDSRPASVGTSTFTALNKYIDVVVDDTIKNGLTYSIIKMYYTDADVAAAGIDEGTLRLSKWDGSQWVKFDPPNGVVDTVNNYVCANTTSFSIWGVFGSLVPVVTTTTSGSSASGGCTAGYEISVPGSVTTTAGTTTTIPVTVKRTGTCSGIATVTATVPAGWSSTSGTTATLGSAKTSDMVNLVITMPAGAKTSDVTFTASIGGRTYTSKTSVNIPVTAPEAAPAPSPETTSAPAPTPTPAPAPTGQTTAPTGQAALNPSLIGVAIGVIVIVAYFVWRMTKKKK